jgi:hypothetical protein
MIRTLPASLALLLAAAPAAAAERGFSVTDFDRIQVDGPYEVILVTGRPSGARVVGPQGALDSVTVEVESRTLKVHANRSAWGGYPGQAAAGPVRIEATTRDLAAATVTGAGSLSIDKAGGLRLSLTLAGSGRLTVGRIAADNLVIALNGSGRIAAAGTAKQLNARVSGSGDLDAAGLAADDAQVYAETSGTVALAARRTAKVQAAGIGQVTIGGTPACTITGPAAGRVTCGR